MTALARRILHAVHLWWFQPTCSLCGHESTNLELHNHQRHVADGIAFDGHACLVCGQRGHSG